LKHLYGGTSGDQGPQVCARESLEIVLGFVAQHVSRNG